MLVGSLGIFYAWKSRPHGRIGISICDYIPLVHRITRNIPNLQIEYNNSIVSENVVFITGILSNWGNKDITNEMIKDTIILSLPANARWLHATMPGQSAAAVSCTASASNLCFNPTLLKNSEHFPFTALIEWDTDHEVKLLDDIKLFGLHFRVADTISVGVKQLIAHRNIRSFFGLFFCVMVLIDVLFATLYISVLPLRDPQFALTINDRVTAIGLRPAEDGKVDITTVHYGPQVWSLQGIAPGDVLYRFSPPEIFKGVLGDVKIYSTRYQEFGIFIDMAVFGLLSFLNGIIIWHMVSTYIRMRRLRGAIKLIT